MCGASPAIPYKNSAKSQMELLEVKSQYLKRKIMDGFSRLSTTEKYDLEDRGSRLQAQRGRKEDCAEIKCMKPSH